MPRANKTTELWTGGCNSLLHPSAVGDRQYYWGENVVNRGGIVQTRPGWRVKASIPGAKLQGFTVFTPRNSTARLVVAVDGKIYIAEYPGYAFRRLAGVSFDAQAEFVVFKAAVQSVKQNPDGSLRAITPTPMLMMQDGTSRAAYWDGSGAAHLDPSANGTPVGLWMEWTSSRLWVMRGRRIYVSDIADPTTFSENTYIAERSNFDLPEEGTGLIETADQTGLLAFTAKNTTAFKSYIHKRTEWANTPDFQKVIIPGIGNVAPRALRNQYGTTYFLSERGFVSLNAALYAQQSSSLVTQDNAMMRSKRGMSPRPLPACACAFENYFLVSVPSGDKYNAHTWALDQNPVDGSGSSWCGIWTGARPVEWATGNVGGRERCFFAGYDKTPFNDTQIHIWEAFHPSREDEGGRVSCQFETGMMSFGQLVRFRYAEIDVVEMLGSVNLKVFVGGSKGGWTQIADIDMQAEKGSIGSAQQLTLDTSSILQTYKPQSRRVKTEEFGSDDAACSPEYKGNKEGVDDYFQLLFEWRGRMGIRKVEFVVDPEAPQNKKGACEASEEDANNAVNAEGEEVA